MFKSTADILSQVNFMTKKTELVAMLNKALELEHAARIQYLTHAELVKGQVADEFIARFKEIAGDEEKHEGMFRECLSILDAEPSMGIAPTHRAEGILQMLEVNLKDERGAVDHYRKIYEKMKEAKEELKYEYEFIEHKVRHVIQEEEEHILELKTLQ